VSKLAIKNIIEFEDRYGILIKNLNQTGISVDIVDDDYNIIYNNEILSDKFGVIQGLKCYEYYLQLDSPCENCPMKKALTNKDIEKEIKSTPDNKIYEIISAPLPNQDGTLDKAVEFVIDITEKSEYEQKLQESEELLKKCNLMIQKSQEIAGVGSFEMDLSTNEVVWSNQLYKLFGLKKEGKFIDYEKVLALIHPDDRERAIKISSDAAKERRPYTLEHRVIHPNGKILNLLITGDVVRNEKNEVIKIGGITQDITERKKIEQKLIKLEAKLKGVMNSITDQVCVLDRNFDILYINSMAEEIYGPSALRSKCYQVYHGLVEPCSDCQVKRTFEDSESHNNECLRRIGEETQWCWCVSNVFERDEEKRPISVVEVSRDITERKKIEQELKDSEEKYRLLFENSPIGIGLSTFEGKILDQNEAMGKLTGYTLEELNKIGILAVYADPNERLKIMDLLKETGEVHDYEVILRRKDSSEIYTSLSLDLIEFEGKKIIQSALRDITEEKKVELELLKLNKLKSELLTRTSHELKTPITIIKGYAELFI